MGFLFNAYVVMESSRRYRQAAEQKALARQLEQDFITLEQAGLIRSIGACALNPPMSSLESAYYDSLGGKTANRDTSIHSEPPANPATIHDAAEVIRAQQT